MKGRIRRNIRRTKTARGLTGTIIGRERSFPDRVAKISFGSCFLAVGLLACQVDSRTEMRSSSSWTLGARLFGHWSNPWQRTYTDHRGTWVNVYLDD